MSTTISSFSKQFFGKYLFKAENGWNHAKASTVIPELRTSGR